MNSTEIINQIQVRERLGSRDHHFYTVNRRDLKSTGTRLMSLYTVNFSLE